MVRSRLQSGLWATKSSEGLVEELKDPFVPLLLEDTL